MKEAFDPSKPLEIESGTSPERKRNPLAQVRHAPEDPKLEQVKATADRDDAMFAAVMRKFIEGGIVLHPNTEKPGRMQIGASESGMKGEDVKIGDLHLEVFDPKAKEIIKNVQDDFFGQHIEESFTRPITKKEALTHEEKLQNIKTLLDTQEARIRLDRDKLRERLAPLTYDPWDGERAQVAIENSEERIEMIREGLRQVARGEIPKQIGAVDAMAASEVRAEEDFDRSRFGAKVDAKQRDKMKDRLETIRDVMKDVSPSLVEEARRRARLQRTFSVLMDEQEQSGRAPERIGSDQLDMEYFLTKNVPPRAKFIRTLYEAKQNSEAALQSEEMRSLPPGHPDLVKQKQRIQMVDQVFQHINDLDPAAIQLATKNLGEIRAFAEEAKKLDLPGEILMGVEELRDGRVPNDAFVKYIVLEQVKAEDAHNEKRVLQMAKILSTLHPDVLSQARKIAERTWSTEKTLRKINAGNSPDKPADPYGKTLAA